MKPGIYDFTHEEYLADPAPSPSFTASLANAVSNFTLRHAALLHPRVNPAQQDKPSWQMSLGTAVHAALLEGKDVIGVVDAADFRTKKAREERDEIIKAGMIPLLTADAAKVQKVMDRHDGVFGGCEIEKTFLFRRDGAWFRSKLDAFDEDYIFDLKTTIMPIKQWKRRAMWDYAMQIGFYSLAFELAHDDCIKDFELVPYSRGFKFVVIEMFEPYSMSIITPDDSAIRECRRLAWRAMQWWIDYHDELCMGKIDSLPEYLSDFSACAMPAWKVDEIHQFCEMSTFRMKNKEKDQWQ